MAAGLSMTVCLSMAACFSVPDLLSILAALSMVSGAQGLRSSGVFRPQPLGTGYGGGNYRGLYGYHD
jgi:hypothetical protein